MKSRVTTKQGDSGKSRTLGGEVLEKSHAIFECCGWLDSLRAYTAILRLDMAEQQPEEYDELNRCLLWLIHCFFLMGAACNDPANKHPEYRKGDIGPAHVAKLEDEQERLETVLHLPKAFIASATNRLAAQADYAATMARTFERHLVRLKEVEPAFDAVSMLAFANRLSDYFYVLARYLEEDRHHVVDYRILED